MARVKGWQSFTIFISVLTVVDLCMIVFMIILYLNCVFFYDCQIDVMLYALTFSLTDTLFSA